MWLPAMAKKALQSPGFRILLALICCAALFGCATAGARRKPSIEFTLVPEAHNGGASVIEPIEGHVTGAAATDRLVLYALSGVWWLQATPDRPFTAIRPDSTWSRNIHLGVVYAALLVDSRYRPPATMDVLPEQGGPILAVAKVPGTSIPTSPFLLQFSGYQWEVRQTSPGGGAYDRKNVWTDKKGFLHLCITGRPGEWVNAEVKLSRSLGYGSYRFVVQDAAHLEPSAVFAISGGDDQGPREVTLQVSRWGQVEDSNAQFIVQPWDVPANSVRFSAPAGTLTDWIKWEPARVTFRTSRASKPGAPAIAEHVFTSGVPAAGSERFHLALYVYDHSPHPMQKEAEIVLESFEFLP
jgi:hypothetical protein